MFSRRFSRRRVTRNSPCGAMSKTPFPCVCREIEPRLRQVLFNLVDNAVKFTERGSIHVRTTLDEETDDTATLRIMVTDTGVGIPADRREMVFEGFSQGRRVFDAAFRRSWRGGWPSANVWLI